MPCIAVQFDPAIGPILNVGIAKPKGTKEEKQSVSFYPLLVDTGASLTCISPQIANQVGLRAMGKRPVGVPSGQTEMNTYLADILVPFGDYQKPPTQVLVAGQSLLVMEFCGGAANYQGLLGRDVIRHGLFSMSSWDNRFIFCA